MKNSLLSIIIPVYNEEKTVEDLLKKVYAAEIGKWKKEIIVINDGSSDRSESIIRRLKKTLPFKIITHKHNKGKGAALIEGIKETKGDFLIIQDGDLEYDPRDIKTLLEYAHAHKAPIVYGSRNLNAKNKRNMSYYWGGRACTWLANTLYGTALTDINTCYKLFRADIIKNISLTSKGFEFCAEVTAKIAKKGIPIAEVPIHYYPRHAKEGKKLKLHHGFTFVWSLIKYKFTR